MEESSSKTIGMNDPPPNMPTHVQMPEDPKPWVDYPRDQLILSSPPPIQRLSHADEEVSTQSPSKVVTNEQPFSREIPSDVEGPTPKTPKTPKEVVVQSLPPPVVPKVIPPPPTTTAVVQAQVRQ